MPRTGAARATPRIVVGFDGCPSGWVAVVLRDGAVADVRVTGSIEAVVQRVQPSHIGVDMPVGLVDGPRDADAAGRALLPGRGAVVFSSPARCVVEAWEAGALQTHAQATACSVAGTGVGLSQQAWRLVPKMAEVERLVAGGLPLTEVHPEVAFATLAGAPLPRKRSWPGLMVRRDLLAARGIDLPSRFFRDDDAAPDDVVDAAICAWVADGLGGAGVVRTVPASTDQYAYGRPIVLTVRET